MSGILMPEAELAAADPAAWYENRLVEEIVNGETELGLLPALVARGSLALDVGANLGIYAYALAKWAARVEAFEPNPAVAALARRMLGTRATLHELAASSSSGQRRFRVPLSEQGEALHFGGNLDGTHAQFPNQLEYLVQAVELDSFGYGDVSLIKVDAEGHELDVLLGARRLIASCRPYLILELLSGTHADPGAEMERICSRFNYEAFVFHANALHPAAEVLRVLNTNTTWGSAYQTRNMLFVPARATPTPTRMEHPDA